MTILPLTYLGNTEWFARLAQGDCIIDIGENWVKQTSRNRCEIMTSGGAATLTVPVHGYGQKIATKDIRIDNSKNWQHRHWVSLVSAYRNSPYFDHYEEKFAPIYARKFNFLTDLNLFLFNNLTSVLKLGNAIEISENYIVASTEDVDMRGKKAFRMFNNLTSKTPIFPNFPEYIQVFSATRPFVGGLSIVDLLFCEGPSAVDFLPEI